MLLGALLCGRYGPRRWKNNGDSGSDPTASYSFRTLKNQPFGLSRGVSEGKGSEAIMGRLSVHCTGRSAAGGLSPSQFGILYREQRAHFASQGIIIVQHRVQ